MRDNKGRFVKGNRASVVTEFRPGFIPWNKGKTLSLEHMKNLSKSHKGQISPNKGRKASEELRDKLRKAHLGKPNPKKGIKTGRPAWNAGLKGFMAKEKHWNWKGGITPDNHHIKQSFEYRVWRTAVFKRDYWTCQICGYKGKKIHANHIKKFSDYPELRYEVSNGITLCANCHLKKVTRREHEWETYFYERLGA